MSFPILFDFQQRQFSHVGFGSRDLILPEEMQWSDSTKVELAAAAAVEERYVGCEPTSVFDSKGSPSPPNSSSTLSSSLSSQPPCAAAANMEHDQSMFGFILNDNGNNDPSGLSKLISAALPVMPGSDLDSQHQSRGNEFGTFSEFGSGQISDFGPFGNMESLFHQQEPHTIESFLSHQQLHHPSQRQNHFLPSGFSDEFAFCLLNPKRVNTGSFIDSDHSQELQKQHLFENIPFFNQNKFQRQVLTVPGKIGIQPGGRMEEMGMNQQAIIEQICKSAELVSMGNLVLAQEILARLNHQLSPIGKPLQRVAYYFKESLQLLLHMSSNNMDFNSSIATSAAFSNFSLPVSLILKLGAFKSFSEISPIVQFENFTSNQAILEAVEMHERIHIIDFDIGYGGQWASLMQELAIRNCSGGMLSLKITAFVSNFDDLVLGMTKENLSTYAQELNIDFNIKIFALDMLQSVPQYIGHDEAIAVNLPIGIFSNCALSLPFVLHIVKQLSPKIVVSLEQGCNRYDLPFAHNVIQAVQYYSTLLESLEALSGNSDTLQKIERFMIHPAVEKFVLQRFHVQDKSLPSRNVFISSGYSPLQFSNFTQSQGECLVERTPVRGFHIEKKQSSLALCWLQKELISVTAWGC